MQSNVGNRNRADQASNLDDLAPDTLEPFLDKEYRDAYLDGMVKGRIAQQMRALREKTGLSQKEFGERIGKPQSVVSRLEDTEYGAVSINTLLDVAKALDVALEVRFTGYGDVLRADLSGESLNVESIRETYATELTKASAVSDFVNAAPFPAEKGSHSVALKKAK